MYFDDFFAIASGYDNGNVDLLGELGTDHEFSRYFIGDPKMQWHAEEKLVVDGSVNSRRRGLPWLEVKLTVVTEPEAQLLEALVGPVTVRFRPRLEDTVGYYNGNLQHLEWGAFDQKQHHFIDVTMIIKLLHPADVD